MDVSKWEIPDVSMTYQRIAQFLLYGWAQFPSRGYMVISISCFLLLVNAGMGMGVIDVLVSIAWILSESGDLRSRVGVFPGHYRISGWL